MLLNVICLDTLPPCAPREMPITGEGADATFVSAGAPEDPPQALVILFGRQADGRSVCAVIKGYRPWSRMLFRQQQGQPSLAAARLAACAPLGNWRPKNAEQSFDPATAIKATYERLPKFYGFEPADAADGAAATWPALKVSFDTFEQCAAFERRFQYADGLKSKWTLTDASTPVSIKALNELGLEPSGWVSLKNAVPRPERASTCDLEVWATVDDLKPEPTITAVAPLRILSFDAEMYSHDNYFPEVVNGDFAMAICATLMTYGTKALQRTAFVVWDCETRGALPVATEGLDVRYCEGPRELFEAFRDYVVDTDPDMLTGWNIYGFDMPFLWDAYDSVHAKPSQRGSEWLHGELVRIVEAARCEALRFKGVAGAAPRPFKTLATLLDGPMLPSQRTALKDAIGKLPLRYKLGLRDAHRLPEAVAEPLRRLVNSAEPSMADLGAIRAEAERDPDSRAMKLFKAVMDVPRTVGGAQRGRYLGRWAFEASQLEEKRMASAAKGDNTYYYWGGRVCVDMMQIIKDDKKLEDNSLKFAAQQFLDPEFGKMDLTPLEMFEAYRKGDATKMAAMLDYCARDADIPAMLIAKLSYVPIWIEMSRVTFTPLGLVLNGGQQRKVYNLIAHFVHGQYAMNKGDSGWPVSNVAEDSDDADAPLDAVEDAMQKRRPDYQGATVIEPAKGYYRESVSTLDFESLYPSIIIHFNLCPSVYVASISGPNNCTGQGSALEAAKLERLGYALETHSIRHSILRDAKADTYDEFGSSYTFVKNVQGVVPRLLQHLLKARKTAKRAMAAAPDEFEKAVQNGRQLALKVSCNSVYGFFGVAPKRGLMSCKPIAAVTTLRGRAFIDAAKTYVEASYAGSKVLYGDTGECL